MVLKGHFQQYFRCIMVEIRVSGEKLRPATSH
jgi:hypothetical protein